MDVTAAGITTCCTSHSASSINIPSNPMLANGSAPATTTFQGHRGMANVTERQHRAAASCLAFKRNRDVDQAGDRHLQLHAEPRQLSSAADFVHQL